jgi:hypothetical protein
MGLKNMSLLTGATPSVTGGSALVFADNGVTIQNGVQCVVPATADYRVRQVLTAKYRAPVLGTDGSYTRDKKSVSFTIPQILANGKIVFNVIRVEREVHPEFSAANCTDMNKIGAQLLFDADMDNFWAAVSLS